MKICEEVLQKLSQDPTLKETISLLALVVTHFWPWDYGTLLDYLPLASLADFVSAMP